MALTLTLTKTSLTSIGTATKTADGDTTVTAAHGLGALPNYAIPTALTGTEAGWRISAMDATNITLAASATGGTANSTCRVLVGIDHSMVK